MSPHSRLFRPRRSAVLAVVLACLAPLLAADRPDGTRRRRGPQPAPGSHGKPVRLLESRLHRLGLLASSAVDGRYRAATVNSVKRFQRLHHVRVTGRVNKSVWNMIAREVNRRIQAARGPAPSIIGHRGAVRPGLAENTLASLRYAHGWADVLEFDLRLTADREIVLMHDATLTRTTNCTGALTSWTLEDLRAQCRVDGQPIPTFAEVAAYAATVRRADRAGAQEPGLPRGRHRQGGRPARPAPASPTGPSCSRSRRRSWPGCTTSVRP